MSGLTEVRMPLQASIAAMGLLAAMAGCAPAVSDAPTQAAQVQARHPESGLPLIPVTVRTAKGSHRVKAELALSRYEQAKGLMFRTELGRNEGMLFPFDQPRQASFHMRNTVIPLDIIFIGQDRRILNIYDNAEPYSERMILSEGLAIAVLELNGGRAAQLGIVPGDKVEW
jgi:uncharacterized membrane protein (UPF0127 family)